jgi:methylase of polypeptide subunit release factors
LNRNLLCYDINPKAIELTESLLDFESENNPKIKVKLHNATKKDEKLKDETIDFVLMHPPYVDIIKYSE